MVVVPQAYFYRRWRDPSPTPPPYTLPSGTGMVLSKHSPCWFATGQTSFCTSVFWVITLPFSKKRIFWMPKDFWRQQVYTSINLLTVFPHKPSLKPSFTWTDATNKEEWERQRSACVLHFCGYSLCEIVWSAAEAPWLCLSATASSHSVSWPHGTK